MKKISFQLLGLEKRKSARVEIRLKVLFTIEGDEDKVVYHAVTRNISHGGVFLKINNSKKAVLEKIGKGFPRFKMLIDAGGDETIDDGKRSAWIRSRLDWIVPSTHRNTPVLIGVVFEGLDEMGKNRLSNIVADHVLGKSDPRGGS